MNKRDVKREFVIVSTPENSCTASAYGKVEGYTVPTVAKQRFNDLETVLDLQCALQEDNLKRT